jgi:membrane-bound serine protease (ClpP class)
MARAVFLGLIAWSVCSFAAPVSLVTLDGAIGPASAHFVKRAIERAGKEGGELVIVQMDTLAASIPRCAR